MRISDWSSDVCSSDLTFSILPTRILKKRSFPCSIQKAVRNWPIDSFLYSLPGPQRGKSRSAHQSTSPLPHREGTNLPRICSLPLNQKMHDTRCPSVIGMSPTMTGYLQRRV